MLSQWFSTPVALGLAQAAIAAALALVVTFIARGRGIHLEREVVIALLRGISQIVVVGLILVVVFQGTNWWAVPVLAVMVVSGAVIASRRARKIPGAFQVALYGIALGAGSVIAVMTLLGVIDVKVTNLIPVGSMIIANAMNTNALALERFRAEVEGHVGPIEAGLALGASPSAVLAPYVQTTVGASLIPSLNSLRSLGIVWIPGLMAGMVLSGSNPIYAAIYQFVVITMLFASAGLTTIVTTLLVRSHAFSAADQLVLRPSET